VKQRKTLLLIVFSSRGVRSTDTKLLSSWFNRQKLSVVRLVLKQSEPSLQRVL
jgi:hypothetical protein